MPIGGTSYQPFSGATQTGATPRVLSPQEAVRILSLRLPKTPQQSPVPQALLTSAGGGATSNLTQLLQALMQASRGGDSPGRQMVGDAFVPPTDNGLGGARVAPTPHIRIGDKNTAPLPPDQTPVPPSQEDTPLFDQGIGANIRPPRLGLFKPPMLGGEQLF